MDSGEAYVNKGPLGGGASLRLDRGDWDSREEAVPACPLLAALDEHPAMFLHLFEFSFRIKSVL